MTLYFFGQPFVAYLIFKNKGAFEATYSQLLHAYSYSFAIYIPVSLLYIAVPLYRMRIFIMLVAGAISLYYLYKETKEIMMKYFDDSSLKSFGAYIGGSTLLWLILFRYYFLQV